MANYANAGHGPRNLPKHRVMKALRANCKHTNTEAAAAIKTASVWCPDCQQWVQKKAPWE